MIIKVKVRCMLAYALIIEEETKYTYIYNLKSDSTWRYQFAIDQETDSNL